MSAAGQLTDAELAAEALSIDPDRSNIIVLTGTKGSGKSEAGRVIFDAWPYDRLVLDVTGDARPDDLATIALTAPWPAALPTPEDGGRVTAWLRVDPRSPTYVEDQDDAISLALYPRSRHCLLWVDEYGQLATAGKILKNTRLALQSSRHYNLSLLLMFPRPRQIPVITLQQADLVFIFRTPNRADRQTLADNMGFPFDRFEIAYAEAMRISPHAFLLWAPKLNGGTLFICPPLPIAEAHGPAA